MMVTVGYESLTVTNAAAVTLTVPAGALRAIITAEGSGGPMRFRIDATDPTTAEGHELNGGDILSLVGPASGRFAVIAQTAVNGVLKVSYTA